MQCSIHNVQNARKKVGGRGRFVLAENQLDRSIDVLRKSYSRTESKELIRIMETEKGVIVKLKEYECVQVGHHKDIGKTIVEWQKNGWSSPHLPSGGIWYGCEALLAV